jgi:hypothetical protein
MAKLIITWLLPPTMIKNPSSRIASLNYLQKAANALIKTGNLELYERTVEWMLKWSSNLS